MRTLAAPFTFHADPIKGSRFIADVAPVATDDEAAAFVREIVARHPDASHHCWAYLLVDGRSRSYDAGEPRGSAGRPILAQLEGHGVCGVVAVVTRWFGGTKLGVGGLIRAYGGSAGRALDRAEIIDVARTVDLVVAHAYDDTNAVQAVIAGYGLEVVDTAFTDTVRAVLRVAVDRVDEVTRALRDRTSGRAKTTSYPPVGIT